MRRCPDLSGQQLVQQLPRIGSLASLQIIHCDGVESSAIRQLQAAFQAEHGRHLPVHYEGWELVISMQ